MDGFTAVVLLIGAGIIAAMMLLLVATAQRYARRGAAPDPGAGDAGG